MQTTTATPDRPTLRIGAHTYPVVLPKVRDPRFKNAVVLIGAHILGQAALGFRVSIAQILVAIGTAMAVDAVVLFRRKGLIEWPTSAMLTGSGIALILRVIGTRHGDWWSLKGWYIFAGVSAFSILSKYIFRPRNVQIFNPNNLGLALCFLLLGSSVVEPLDFWWGPMSGALIIAYVVIIVGGSAATSQVRMFAMPVTFWITFSAASALLASGGHCITARWSFEAICGGSYWWVVSTSPEVLVFLFFMITDPKAVPRGHVARVAFSAATALLAVLLMAPQQTEFGAKVALLSSLVLLCSVHKYFERAFPTAHSPADSLRMWLGTWGPQRSLAIAGAVAAFAAAVMVAGAPARAEPAGSGLVLATGTRPEIEIDPAAVPPVEISDEVRHVYQGVEESEARLLARDLIVDLQIAAEALRTRDSELATSCAHGLWLDSLQQQIAAAERSGEVVVPSYRFDSLALVITNPGGPQSGALVGLEVSGEIETVVYGGPSGAEELERASSPYSAVFALRSTEAGYYVVVDELPT